MRAEDLRNVLSRRPFQPRRFTLTDGSTYKVQHPEMLLVGRSTLGLGLPGPGIPEPVHDRFVTLSLLHIMQAEPVEPSLLTTATAPPSAN